MKQFIFSVLVTVGVLASTSCDRHEWENSEEGVKDGTKNLFHAEEQGDGHSEKKAGAHDDEVSHGEEKKHDDGH